MMDEKWFLTMKIVVLHICWKNTEDLAFVLPSLIGKQRWQLKTCTSWSVIPSKTPILCFDIYCCSIIQIYLVNKLIAQPFLHFSSLITWDPSVPFVKARVANLWSVQRETPFCKELLSSTFKKLSLVMSTKCGLWLHIHHKTNF